MYTFKAILISSPNFYSQNPGKNKSYEWRMYSEVGKSSCHGVHSEDLTLSLVGYLCIVTTKTNFIESTCFLA